MDVFTFAILLFILFSILAALILLIGWHSLKAWAASVNGIRFYTEGSANFVSKKATYITREITWGKGCERDCVLELWVDENGDLFFYYKSGIIWKRCWLAYLEGDAQAAADLRAAILSTTDCDIFARSLFRHMEAWRRQYSKKSQEASSENEDNE